MMNVSLLQQRAKKVLLHADFLPAQGKNDSLEVNFRYNFNVSYADDNRHCKATLEQIVQAVDDPQQFSINVEIEGIFETDLITNDDEKKEVHVKSYYSLFPYAQLLIYQMSTSAGFPPLMIPPDKMTVDGVVIKQSED